MSSKIEKRKKQSNLENAESKKMKTVGNAGVSDEVHEYFKHISNISVTSFSDEEEKEAFIENVFDQLLGHEEYCKTKVVSRVIDMLLPDVPDNVLTRFVETLEEELKSLCCDRHSSFVIQKSLIVCTTRYLNCSKEQSETIEKNEEAKKSYRNWLIKVGKCCLNNLEEFIQDMHANHIMRTTLACLMGKPNLNCKTMAKTNKNAAESEISNACAVLIVSFVDKVMAQDSVEDLFQDSLTSGFIQVLLQAVATVDDKKLSEFGAMLLEYCVQQNHLFDSDNPCLRVLEVLVGVSPTYFFNEIYAKCFETRLTELALGRYSNHSIQKLIAYCSDASMFEKIFQKLLDDLENILKSGNIGVILELCDGCRRFKMKQLTFVQRWMNILHCSDKDLLTSTVYWSRDLQSSSDNPHVVSLSGSLMVQRMLHFNKPVKIVSSILNTDPSELVDILCDPKGSYIADAFFSGEYVGEKSRKTLMHILENHYTTLCISKHGSRVFDTIWKAANVKFRTSIATELLENEAQLNSTQFGKAIVRNISLRTLRHRRESWIITNSEDIKTKKLFSDIVRKL